MLYYIAYHDMLYSMLSRSATECPWSTILPAALTVSNLPSLYICLAWNVLGRVPLTPYFVRGKRTPTLPLSFGNSQGAVADSRNGAGNGSRLYEVNIWDVALLQGTATVGYCRRGWAATEGCHLWRSQEGCRHYEASPGGARGRLVPKTGSRWRRCLRLKIWCYIAGYIPYYIAHAI